MKVAIIGAGLAGLACALELKKNGIVPDIYEKKPAIGHPLEQSSTTFNIFDAFFMDPLKRIKGTIGFEVSPIYALKEIIMKGPSKTTTVKGKLGYVFKRGVEDYSIENQLARALDLPIIYNHFADVQSIKNQYDSIVVATGDGNIAKNFNLWTTTFHAQIRVATVLGNFKSGRMNIWINTDFTKNCYAYLLPVSTKEGCLVLIANDVKGDEFEYYWKEFLFTQEIQYKIIETRDWHNILGYANPLTYENIIFTGNAAGLNDDFLGFGVMAALESGVYAARSIVKKEDYNKSTQKLIKNVIQIHEFREAFNTFENEEIDKLLTLLDMPGIKQFIYNNPLFRAKDFSRLPKLYKDLIGK